MERRVERDEHCFVCGMKNERGLRLKFAYPRPGRAETQLRIPEHFSGWRRMTHGGLLATLLDEAMAHACISSEGPAVTAQMEVRFLKPVEVGETVRISGEVREAKARVLLAQAQVTSGSGEVIARASARFLKV